jgi:hypothetical protein
MARALLVVLFLFLHAQTAGASGPLATHAGLGGALGAGPRRAQIKTTRTLLQGIVDQCQGITNLSSTSLTGVYCSPSNCPSGCAGGGGLLQKCIYGGLVCAVRGSCICSSVDSCRFVIAFGCTVHQSLRHPRTLTLGSRTKVFTRFTTTSLMCSPPAS